MTKLILALFNVFQTISFCTAQDNADTIKTNIGEGIYIFYNKKNCYPCYLTLRSYFTNSKTIRKTDATIYAVSEIDSDDYSIKRFMSFYKFNLFYCDTLLLYYYSADNIIKTESLFDRFHITSTPAIVLIKGSDVTVLHNDAIFKTNTEVSGNFQKIISSTFPRYRKTLLPFKRKPKREPV